MKDNLHCHEQLLIETRSDTCMRTVKLPNVAICQLRVVRFPVLALGSWSTACGLLLG